MNGYQVSVFISHSWSYSDHYEKLAGWIFQETWLVGQQKLSFVDMSVPKDNPIHFAPNEEELRRAIFEKIALSHVIVIPAGMYANHSKWIEKEIDGSQQYGKPILAVNLWGQERSSSVVMDAAAESVGWNKKSVVNSIWKLKR